MRCHGRDRCYLRPARRKPLDQPGQVAGQPLEVVPLDGFTDAVHIRMNDQQLAGLRLGELLVILHRGTRAEAADQSEIAHRLQLSQAVGDCS